MIKFLKQYLVIILTAISCFALYLGWKDLSIVLLVTQVLLLTIKNKVCQHQNDKTFMENLDNQ